MLNGNNNGAFCPNGVWDIKWHNMKYQHFGQCLTQSTHCVWSLLSSNCLDMNSVTWKVGWIESVSGNPVPKKPEEVIEATLGVQQAIIHCVLSQVTLLLWAWVSSLILAKLLWYFSEIEVKLRCTWPVLQYNLNCKLLGGGDHLVLTLTPLGPTCFSGVPS